MKKSILIILLTSLLSSCDSKLYIEKYEITKIEVFHVPFDIPPLQMNESSIRKIKSYQFQNKSEIKSIIEEMKHLSKTSFFNEINDNNIYLISDFYTKEKKVLSLVFDKNLIELNGRTYKNHETLINYITKK